MTTQLTKVQFQERVSENCQNDHLNCSTRLKVLEHENKLLLSALHEHEILISKMLNMFDRMLTKIEQLSMEGSKSQQSQKPPRLH